MSSVILAAGRNRAGPGVVSSGNVFAGYAATLLVSPICSAAELANGLYDLKAARDGWRGLYGRLGLEWPMPGGRGSASANAGGGGGGDPGYLPSIAISAPSTDIAATKRRGPGFGLAGLDNEIALVAVVLQLDPDAGGSYTRLPSGETHFTPPPSPDWFTAFDAVIAYANANAASLLTPLP